MLDVKFKLQPGHKSERVWMAPAELETVFWNITYACNYNCGICFSNSGARRDEELTTAQCLAAVENVHRAGLKDIVISGGEPFMRGDLLEILARMKDLGMTARIATNGSLLTEEILDRLVRETLTKSFQISLDVLGEKAYEAFHRSPKSSLAVALKTVEFVRDRGFHTTVSVRLTPETLEGIPQLLDLAVEKNWATVTMHWPLHAGRSVGAYPQDTDFLSLLEPVFEHFFSLPKHWLIETYIPWAPYHPVIRRMKNTGKWSHIGCSAGRQLLAIHPTGMITPCVCMDFSDAYLGNVKTDDLREVFRKAPICAMLRHPKQAGICTECGNVAVCGGGCRSSAYALTGNLDGQDKSCSVWKLRTSRKETGRNAV